jgi:hypothetical protein
MNNTTKIVMGAAAVIVVVGIIAIASPKKNDTPQTQSKAQTTSRTPEDHTQADTAAIRTFMGDSSMELTFEGNKHPDNFMIAKETVIGNGAGRYDTPAEWERYVNLYADNKLVGNGLCEKYEFEVDTRNSQIVEVHIRTLTPEELQHMSAVGESCAGQRTQGPTVTKAQAQATAEKYLSTGAPSYSEIQGKLTYATITGKYAAHEWSWKDTSFKVPEGLVADPFPYPIIRIQMSADGKLVFYGNTTSLFKM